MAAIGFCILKFIKRMKKIKPIHPAILQYGLQDKKILWLTLNKTAYEVTGTEEKMVELRHDSNWIRSRLFNKDKSEKQYDYVLLMHGYGHDKPWKLFNYSTLVRAPKTELMTYSNGLKFKLNKGDWMIFFSKIERVKSNCYACQGNGCEVCNGYGTLVY